MRPKAREWRLEQLAADNAAAQQECLAKERAVKKLAASNALDRDADAEDRFKQQVRAQYFGLSDSDFERLWGAQLRYTALFRHAATFVSARRDAYVNFI